MVERTCVQCQQEFDVTPECAVLLVYVCDPIANHFMAQCPKCKAGQMVFMPPKRMIEVARTDKFELAVFETAPEHVKIAAKAVWNVWMAQVMPGQEFGRDIPHAEDLEPVEDDDLPAAPREWVRQLHDDLRRFGKNP